MNNKSNSNNYIRSSGVRRQQNSLGAKESDWKLPGLEATLPPTRTRGGGNGRPTLAKRLPLELSSDSDDDEEEVPMVDIADSNDGDEEMEDAGEEEEDDNDEEEVAKKPFPSRIIIETNALTDMIENIAQCSVCAGPVQVEYNTICIATSIMVTCKDAVCGYVYHSIPPAIANIGDSKNRERNTDYALNIQYVLGFLTSGDGGVEAARLLGLMGLPNDTTMETRSFPTIEERISPFMQQLAKEILLDNLVEEVRLSFEDANDFRLWKLALTDPTIQLTQEKYARIDVSFDMGWQQRASGKKYNSLSGDALMVGGRTRRPVAMIIKSKRCNFCIAWKRNINNVGDPPAHECKKNHNGESKAMEAAACLDMTVGLYNEFCCIVRKICLDDDASTRGTVRWSNADYMRNNNTNRYPMVYVTRGKNKGIKMVKRPDNGRLPGHIPEPMFVADPNHRKKVFTGDLYALKMKKGGKNFTMTGMDVVRLGKNFGYMIRCLKKQPESEWEKAAKAVLEHHFDNHEYCGRWCPRLRQSAEQRKAAARYYRCKTKDAKLYNALHDILERFTTMDKLRDVAHGMDTQINESFNNTFSWFAPKNKVYCGSESLTNRLSIAIGVNSVGLEMYFVRLFRMMKITMPADILHFLGTKQRHRERRHNKRKHADAKKARANIRYAKLKKAEADAKKSAINRDGKYQSGMNMAPGSADGYTAEELLAAAAKKPKGDKVCPFCQKRGHKTQRSTKCLYYNKPLPTATVDPPTPDRANTSAADFEDEDAAEDLNRYEELNIDNDEVSIDNSSLAGYVRAEDYSWTSDEEEEQEDPLASGAI
jgi:hypothetical protein